MDVNSVGLPFDYRIGFGTAYLLNGNSSKEAIRLLDSAIDDGLQYFDTARMYCGGSAEAALGSVYSRRKENMFIATKAGILPPSQHFAAKVARKIAAVTGTPVAQFAKAPAHRFRPEQVRASLHKSLLELGTDRIDLLLLHEAAPADVTDDLLAMLERLRAEGQIGAYGLATGRGETRAILAQYPGVFAFAQVPDSIWLRLQDKAGFDGVPVLATHSLLGAAFSHLVRRLQTQPEMQARWQERLEMDSLDVGQLARLFLAEALDANGRGPVIFSSSNPANIRANMAILDNALPHGKIEQLRGLVGELSMTQ